NIYVVTGNGPWNGKSNWGDSVLELNPAGNTLVDAFTPTNQDYLNSNDLDLGSTAPGILPPISANGKTWHLMTQGGKGPDGSSGGPAVIWLLNRDQLGSAPGPGHLGGQLDDISSPGGAEVLTAPAVWKNPGGSPVVIYANDSGVTAYTIDTSGSTPKLKVDWSSGNGGSSPVVVNGVMYMASDGHLATYNPANGHQMWSTSVIGG